MCSFQCCRSAALFFSYSFSSCAQKNRLNVNPEIPVRSEESVYHTDGYGGIGLGIRCGDRDAAGAGAEADGEKQEEQHLYAHSHVDDMQHKWMKLRIWPDQARDEPWASKDYSTAIQANCQWPMANGQFPRVALIDNSYL